MKSLIFQKTPLSISTSGNAARLLGPVSIVWLLAAAVGAHTPAFAEDTEDNCSAICYVSETGNDADTGNADAPKATIQAAINQVDPGGEVIVEAGTYEQSLYVWKELTLTGPNAGVAGSDGSRGSEAVIIANQGTWYAVYVDGHNVTIDGVQIESNAANIGAFPYHTFTQSVTNFTLQNSRLIGGEIQLFVATSGGQNVYRTGLMVERNYFDGGPFVNSVFHRAMYIQGTAGTIQDNVIENASIGIQYMPYRHLTGALIQRNSVSAGLIGLYHNYQNRGAAPVSWEDNDVRIAPNDQLGDKLLVNTPWDTPVTFRGIHVITFGAQGSGDAPAVSFLNNRIDGELVSDETYNSTLREAFRISDGTIGTVGLFENSFENYTTGVQYLNSGATVTATCNWWGTTDATVIGTGIATDVTFEPFLTNGLDSSPAIGFQPFDNSCGPDGEAPLVTNVAADPNPAPVGTTVVLTATATDNVAVTAASYTIDGGAPVAFTVTPDESVSLSASIAGLGVGVYELCVTAEDVAGNTADAECTQLAVYDPSAGFVTGGGWFNSPAGAFKADLNLTGRANFGFVSRYQRGASVPTGNTAFQFQAGRLSFSSTSYEWLVVNRADTNAQYKGVGTVTIDGVATTGAGFMLWAQDGKPDLFRIMISDPNGDLIYDNKIGSEFGTAIGGGNIIVHTK